MRMAVHVRKGPAAGRRIVFRLGQVARFGRTDWADYAFPDDSAMADVHFAIQCESHRCSLQALATDKNTLVNGQAVKQVELKAGDVIEAGRSSFQVHIDTDTDESGFAVTPSEKPQEATPDDKVGEQATYYGLSTAALEIAATCNRFDEFPGLLIKAGLIGDAVRWYAFHLPKPTAVMWACACTREIREKAPLSALQQAAFEAAEAWAKQPDDAHRDAAKAMLEATDSDGLGGALTAAAAWSGGSLAPPDQPEVPPDPRLTGRAVLTAIKLAAYIPGSTALAPQRLRGFLNLVPQP